MSVSSFAQESTQDVDLSVKRIGLVDIEGVLRSAEASEKVRSLLDEQRGKFQQEFNIIEKQLQDTERDLTLKRGVISDAEFDNQRIAFQKKVTQLQQDIQYRRQALDNAYQKAQNDLRALAIDILTEIAAEKQLDLILARNSALIFLPHFNISNEVLLRLNERTKNAKIEIEITNPDDN
ncbi:OmpH family outer membrane protein [Candidatus Puniceispirillum sp.]|uniref:OmpH family outer membrane protein n=1 Tax=Candidatus Puniceispirillum sp. TaxID=2026719 RepID=UPI001EB94F89|nr:OmpH family outer membrane protein [Candidatus Puniceispirillum sp.]MBT6566944.1 OmpH family outer membrane protein [Candidatus Puniceispirillum sp.]